MQVVSNPDAFLEQDHAAHPLLGERGGHTPGDLEGEQRRGQFVGGRKGLSPQRPRDIQGADGLRSKSNRDAEEGAHSRVPRGPAIRVWVRGEVVHAERPIMPGKRPQ